jgi:uncharacterized protein (DUF302 family)
MKMIQSVTTALVFLVASWASGADGVIAVKSPRGPKDTMDRLETLLKQKDMTIFVRIDHAAGASKVGQTLRPNRVADIR